MRIAPFATIRRLRAENEQLRGQLPAEMQNCTIVFKECGKGHGWLTATNWVQHGCPTCALATALAAERAAVLKADGPLADRISLLVYEHSTIDGDVLIVEDGQGLRQAIELLVVGERVAAWAMFETIDKFRLAGNNLTFWCTPRGVVVQITFHDEDGSPDVDIAFLTFREAINAALERAAGGE